MHGLLGVKQKVYSDWGNKGLLGLKQKLYSDWSSKGLLGLKQKLYSDWSTRSTQTRSIIYSNKVYITRISGVSQAQIQEQHVLGSNQKCSALGFKHNVYSDSITMCTQIRIGAQWCNQTQIQAPSVLRLDQQGIQINASNCD
jgi:hypothetical protein